MSCREMFTHIIRDKKPPLFEPKNQLFFTKNISPLYPLMSTVTPDLIAYTSLLAKFAEIFTESPILPQMFKCRWGLLRFFVFTEKNWKNHWTEWLAAPAVATEEFCIVFIQAL